MLDVILMHANTELLVMSLFNIVPHVSEYPNIYLGIERFNIPVNHRTITNEDLVH